MTSAAQAPLLVDDIGDVLALSPTLTMLFQAWDSPSSGQALSLADWLETE